MKISVNMIVLNEELWLKAAIDSVYDWADEIVILEGCVPEYMELGFVAGNFLSVDDTTKIIDGYNDKDNKIKVLRKEKPWKHKNAMRQATLNESSGDWILVLDGDEVYKKEHLDLLKERAKKTEKDCISYPHRNFWTFDKILDERSKPVVMERFFKRFEGMYYPDKNTGQSAFEKDGAMVWHNKEHFDDICVYHYAKLKPRDYTLRKSQYYLVRDYGKTREQAPIAAHKDYQRWQASTLPWDINDHPETIKETEVYREYYSKGESHLIH